MKKKVLEAVNARHPFVCERNLLLHDHKCGGRITREHSLIFAGEQIDEAWAVVLLCEKSHSLGEWMNGRLLSKRINEWIAVNRMTKADQRWYPHIDWNRKKKYLNGIYGAPKWPKTKVY